MNISRHILILIHSFLLKTQNGARAHLLPLSKKFKKNTRKIQKIPNFFVVVDNLTREVRPKIQLIWLSEQLLAKKTNRDKTVREQYTFLQTLILSFLLRVAQMSK